MTDLQWQLPLELIYWTALCSIIALLAHVSLVKFHWFGFSWEDQVQVQNSHSTDTYTKVFITNDNWPYVSAILRFLGCLAIFALSVAEVYVSRPSSFGIKHSKNVILCLVFAYTTVLSLSAFLIPRSHRRRDILLKIHINTVLLVALVVYTVRDVYPLVTYSKHPIDLDLSHKASGRLLWTKIILLVLTAVLIPLASPSVWTPVDTEIQMIVTESNTCSLLTPNPEQVASPLSLLFFAFLEHIVWKAYRVDHLPAEKLPPLADSDHIRWLKKKWFPTLQRYSSAYTSISDAPKDTERKPGRKLPYTLVWMFRWTWMSMIPALVILAFGNVGSPLAINRLLSYLEDGGSSSSSIESFSSWDSDIRPFFWIIILFLSPLAVTLSMEWYLRIVLRLNVQLDALLTQLVFEHSLKIRVEADPESVTSAAKSSNKSGGRDGKSTGDDKKPPSKKKGSAKSKSPTGRINNLVTTDLSNIAELRNWIQLFFKTPLEVVLCVVFLYNILGWSTFVGIGLMVALAPVPMKIINAGRKLFLERMKKTDVRVGVFTDVMSSLRMVKLFGWEGKMSQRVLDVREEELHYLQRRRVFLMFSNLVNYVVPLVAITGCFVTLGFLLDVASVYVLAISALLRRNSTLSLFTSFPSSFLTHSQTLIMKEDLTPSRVFSSLVVFERLQNHVRYVFVNLNRYYAGLISIGRIEEFLGETELIDVFDSTSVTISRSHLDEGPSEDEDHGLLIGFSNATFSWSKEDEKDFIKSSSAISPGTIDVTIGGTALEENPSGHVPELVPQLEFVDNATVTSVAAPPMRKFFLSISDEVLFHRNCINLIIGPTGSGKTALLLALLGEMHFISTPTASGSSCKDSWFHLPRGNGLGSVAYAAQESWVQNETIRENILFHSPFEQERYDKVLYQCALERDLALFDAGDLTEVGERGMTLSGGQKARLTLARAVYSKAKVLLLDDVLAALDVHTAKWIVEKCFLGDLMQDRTVLLVTHNTALTLPIASFVITVKDGRIVSQDVMQKSSGGVEAQVEEATAYIEGEPPESKAKIPGDETDADQKASGKLVMDEEVQVGHISWSAIKLYATALGGRFPVLFFSAWLGGSIFTQLTMVFQTWYLGYWASQYEGRDSRDVPVALYLAGYGGVVMSTVILTCLTTLNYIYGVIRASEYIHRRLVASILGTTMRWLDKTPVSRIITRATQDINSVDTSIVMSLTNFFEVCIRLLSRLGAVVIFSPVFVLPGILLMVVGVSCGSVYFKAQMSVKREMSIAKAPVLGHFAATIVGLTSIRAYGAQELSIIEMQTRTDRHSRIARIFNNLQRWMAVRINILSAVFTTSLACYLVYVLRQSASVTGFSLNMAVSFSSAIFSFVLEFNALEARSNSLERIDNYLNIEQEEKPQASGEPPAYWPASGDLRVESLSARYSSDGPEVLHQLSFHIKSGERIGVVGRTGSGKSSLALSLLRCIHTSGDVFYDGQAINKINLEALRSRITIIPQIPELISGSLRENLDPFTENDDLTLNDALKSAGLQALQEEMAEKDRITLDTLVSSGGANFSLGQRQIIALARAIVRRSKLLILDEATSAIDYKTDSIIQSSLRSQLTGEITLITIAHRLQTIMDVDRIMVLDAGSIVEFDTPLALLAKTDSHLRALVDQSHDKDVLIELAREKAS